MIFSNHIIWHYVFNIQSYLISLLGFTAVIGDLLVRYANKHVYRALFDNTTHAIIGGLAWLIVTINYRNRSSIGALLEISSCTAISSLIDLDHFFAAKSLSLKDATNLKNRPVLHCTSIPLFVALVLLLISSALELQFLQRCSLIILTAFATHHTRDATRRGYWLYPFGSTQPIPYFGYILITLAIPYMVCGIMNLLKIRKATTYNYGIL